MDKKFHLRQYHTKKAISSIDRAIEAENELLSVLLKMKNDLIKIYNQKCDGELNDRNL